MTFSRALQVKTLPLYLVAILILFAVGVQAADRISIGGRDGLDPRQDAEPYSVLLALSGGGARGLSTIGILRAFEEKGIQTTAIAGTSMGGIVGGLYASGYSASDLERIVRGIDFSDLFSNRPSRKSMFQTQRQEEGKQLFLVRFDGFRPVIPRALTAGQKLTSILTGLTVRATYLSGGSFDRLPIPFKTICTDIVSGEKVVMDHGSLADAMRATMAFPLAFTPLERDNQLLMDGGLVTPIPVDLVRTMSDKVRFVVAVNTVSPLLPKEELTTPIDIANQATTIMTADKLQEELDRADFVITPEISQYQLADFPFRDSLIAAGYRAGLAAADSIIAALHRRQQTDTLAVISVVGADAPAEVTRALSDALGGRTINREELVRELKRTALDLNLFSLDCSVHDISRTSDGYQTVALQISACPTLALNRATFRFQGNHLFSDSVLATRLPVSDSTITSAWIKTAVDSLLAFYRRASFDLTAVRSVDIDRAHDRVTFALDEAIIRHIEVHGNRRTRSWFVRSLFPLHVGQPYSSSRAAKGIANIYGTNLFDRVTIDLTPADSGAVVTIGLEEKQPTQLRVGWHWHDEYASEEYLELRDPNVNGIGLEYTAHAQYGTDRQVYSTSLKLDRIRFTYLTGRIEAYHTILDRRVYDSDADYLYDRHETKTGAELRFGQQIARFGTVSAGLAVEQVSPATPGFADQREIRPSHPETRIAGRRLRPRPLYGIR